MRVAYAGSGRQTQTGRPVSRLDFYNMFPSDRIISTRNNNTSEVRRRRHICSAGTCTEQVCPRLSPPPFVGDGSTGPGGFGQPGRLALTGLLRGVQRPLRSGCQRPPRPPSFTRGAGLHSGCPPPPPPQPAAARAAGLLEGRRGLEAQGLGPLAQLREPGAELLDPLHVGQGEGPLRRDRLVGAQGPEAGAGEARAARGAAAGEDAGLHSLLVVRLSPRAVQRQDQRVGHGSAQPGEGEAGALRLQRLAHVARRLPRKVHEPVEAGGHLLVGGGLEAPARVLEVRRGLHDGVGHGRGLAEDELLEHPGEGAGEAGGHVGVLRHADGAVHERQQVLRAGVEGRQRGDLAAAVHLFVVGAALRVALALGHILGEEALDGAVAPGPREGHAPGPPLLDDLALRVRRVLLQVGPVARVHGLHLVGAALPELLGQPLGVVLRVQAAALLHEGLEQRQGLVPVAAQGARRRGVERIAGRVAEGGAPPGRLHVGGQLRGVVDPVARRRGRIADEAAEDGPARARGRARGGHLGCPRLAIRAARGESAGWSAG